MPRTLTIARPILGALAVAAIAHMTFLAQSRVDAHNVELVSHHDLNGHGDGGEGLAIQQWPDGRRFLYLAHEGTRTCLSVVDVTRPESPTVVTQLPSPAPGTTRCNSLGLARNVLVIANQTDAKGKRPAGLWVLDVSDVERIRRAKTLENLLLSFFDASGPNSQGAHCVWFVDGEFAHLTTGMPDFEPTNPNNHQIYVIVDLRNPREPREVGRWWYAGTRRGDPCLPGCLPARNAKVDTGYRPHQTEVWPDHPDRAYVGYIDGGGFILDISGLADVKAGRTRSFTPTVVSHTRFSPPYPAWTHTFQPIFDRRLAFASDEAVRDNCADAPKLVWLVDIRNESNPVIIGTAPLHATDGRLCSAGGRLARTTSIRIFQAAHRPICGTRRSRVGSAGAFASSTSLTARLVCPMRLHIWRKSAGTSPRHRLATPWARRRSIMQSSMKRV